MILNATTLDPTRLNDETYHLAHAMAEAADDRKGADISLLAIGEVSMLAEYFVIATGFSKAQVRAMATSIQDKIEQEFGRTPRNISGENDGTWVLLDYGDVIAHLMMAREREYYGLEAFWGHAPKITFVPSSPDAPVAAIAG
ncbi:MAG: ribosome silencing factor [Pseudanabaena sp. ELA607]